MTIALQPLPTQSGAYRWYYVDAACGEWTAVCIFMIGSPFSPWYSERLAQGAKPGEHCAVNLALYNKGKRVWWVLTEYPSCELVADRTLSIGTSSLSLVDGAVKVHVADRTAPWGRPWGLPVEATLTLVPQCQPLAEVQLVEREPHWWQPLAARASVVLEVPAFGLRTEGHGYFDTNHGATRLGDGVNRWKWTRAHRADHTEIHYWPHGEREMLRILASASDVRLERTAPTVETETRTPWGLSIPQSGTVLESSPFYARMERWEGDTHHLGEVADFERFHRPSIRWMAKYRTRREA